MSYYTDKAFSSRFLENSKGLDQMIVKKDDSDGAQQSTYSFNHLGKHEKFEMKANTLYDHDDRTTYRTTKRFESINTVLWKLCKFLNRFTTTDRGHNRDTNFTTRKHEENSLKLPASSVRQDFVGDYRASKERILAQSWAREEKPTPRKQGSSSSSYVDRKEEKRASPEKQTER